jgi:hypothetical protein
MVGTGVNLTFIKQATSLNRKKKRMFIRQYDLLNENVYPTSVFLFPFIDT